VRIDVLYFGVLKESRGREREAIELAKAAGWRMRFASAFGHGLRNDSGVRWQGGEPGYAGAATLLKDADR